MTTTFTWAIANLDREIADGFVYTAHYTVNATDGEAYSAGAYGSIGFERPEELIPFDNLTPEIVINWVKEKLGEEQVEKVETALQSQIDEKRAPTKASGTPW